MCPRHVYLAALLLLVTSRAHAQSSDANVTLAETLFDEGQRLMREKNYDRACPKFAESQKLDPGTGTLLNLAACYEAAGKTASAWARYKEAIGAARRDGRQDRVEFATGKSAALEPKLARLQISVAKESAVSGLVVTLDGAEIPSAAWGVAAPVDPGRHHVAARSPDGRAFEQELPSLPAGQTTTVSIVLGKSETAAAVDPGQTGSGAAAATSPTPASSGQADEGSPSGGRSTAILIAGIATGALAAGAIVTGIMYQGKKSDFDEQNAALDPARNDTRSEAQTLGVVNAALVGGAVVGAGVTLYLVLTQPSSKKPEAVSARISPLVGGGSYGLSVNSCW